MDQLEMSQDHHPSTIGQAAPGSMLAQVLLFLAHRDHGLDLTNWGLGLAHLRSHRGQLDLGLEQVVPYYHHSTLHLLSLSKYQY